MSNKKNTTTRHSYKSNPTCFAAAIMSSRHRQKKNPTLWLHLGLWQWQQLQAGGAMVSPQVSPAPPAMCRQTYRSSGFDPSIAEQRSPPARSPPLWKDPSVPDWFSSPALRSLPRQRLQLVHGGVEWQHKGSADYLRVDTMPDRQLSAQRWESS